MSSWSFEQEEILQQIAYSVGSSPMNHFYSRYRKKQKQPKSYKFGPILPFSWSPSSVVPWKCFGPPAMVAAEADFFDLQCRPPTPIRGNISLKEFLWPVRTSDWKTMPCWLLFIPLIAFVPSCLSKLCIEDIFYNCWSSVIFRVVDGHTFIAYFLQQKE